MNKQLALKFFRDKIRPKVIEQYGKDDRMAIQLAWSEYTDHLCKNGLISQNQYDRWSNPF